jgi:positive regulator of sigma E activity
MESLQGEVAEIRDGKALVRVQLRKVCSDCARCEKGEGWGLFEAEAPPGLAPGDRVAVLEERISGLSPVRSALLFSLPILALVCGIGLGRVWRTALPQDVLSGLLGFGLFIAAFFAVNEIYSRKTRVRCTISRLGIRDETGDPKGP